MIKFVNDPFRMLTKIFNKKWPQRKIVIQFDPRMGKDEEAPFGETIFPNDESEEILINISTNISFEDMVEILAHELAHVATGIEGGHTKDWEDNLDYLHDEFLKNPPKDRKDEPSKVANDEE